MNIETVVEQRRKSSEVREKALVLLIWEALRLSASALLFTVYPAGDPPKSLAAITKAITTAIIRLSNTKFADCAIRVDLEPLHVHELAPFFAAPYAKVV